MGNQQEQGDQGDGVPRMKVLIVEDEERASEGLVAELAARQVSSDVAVNYHQAVSMLAVVRYGAVVVDLMLPEGDKLPEAEVLETSSKEHFGLQLLRQIRSSAPEGKGTGRNSLVFVLTAVVDHDVLNSVVALAPEEIFRKPESPAFIAEHIRLRLEDTQ